MAAFTERGHLTPLFHLTLELEGHFHEIYPESLVPKIQDQLALAGGQRMVTLGYAGAGVTGFGAPQDGVEPVRRLCK